MKQKHQCENLICLTMFSSDYKWQNACIFLIKLAPDNNKTHTQIMLELKSSTLTLSCRHPQWRKTENREYKKGLVPVITMEWLVPHASSFTLPCLPTVNSLRWASSGPMSPSLPCPVWPRSPLPQQSRFTSNSRCTFWEHRQKMCFCDMKKIALNFFQLQNWS